MSIHDSNNNHNREKSAYAVAFAAKAAMANDLFIPPHTLRCGKLNETVGWRESKPPKPGYVIRIQAQNPRRIQHLFLTGGKHLVDGSGSLKTQLLRFAKVFETYDDAMDFI